MIAPFLAGLEDVAFLLSCNVPQVQVRVGPDLPKTCYNLS